MKQRVLQIITALLLIVTLTMANFLLLCVDVVSYAADAINADKSTNHKNIEFMAYFKNQKGNEVTDLDAYTNSDDLKLYFQISVKKEGYFNGNITLNDSNFKLKSDILSDGVSKIEGNTIYLNQINAGENKEISVGIELLKNEQFDLKFINMEDSVSLNGIYRDSTQKDISIKADKKVVLNLVNPYMNKEDASVLSQEIITNKIMKINGENKRVIQIDIKSGLNNNLYPIKNSKINIKTPKISDKYPENVLVNSNNALVTNGKNLLESDWKYNNETGMISIDIENKQENGKVSWLKTGSDDFIVTYIYESDVQINKEKLEINSEIVLYDKATTTISSSNEITLTEDERDSIITSNIQQSETSIYKGKLYAGVSRDITYKNIMNINLNNVETEVSVKESEQTLNGQKIESTYKTSKFNKTQIENVLGNTGVLSIVNSNNGNTIATINKNSVANNNGDIVVTYPQGIESIIIKIQPERIGKIEVETTREIGTVQKELVKQANSISVNTSVSYVSDGKENKLKSNDSNIELLETETSADLQINRTELSAMTKNSNVEFRVVLKSNEEKDELFKNPVVRLQLPDKIEKIEVNSINVIYGDEFVIKNASLDGNTIILNLQGEQKDYNDMAIEGATIIINANLTTSTKIPSSVEQVRVTYINENAVNYKDGANVGTVSKDINIVSYAGVVTTNQISEYGIEVVNNQGVNDGELPVSTDIKTVNIEKKIINNKENKISNVKVLGVFPTKQALDANNIDIQVGNVTVTGVDSSRVKVYYSNNADATEDLDNKSNNWTENIEDSKNVKKYLVVINYMDLLEEADITYPITIPSNLEYNESAEEGYTVYYTNLTSNEKVDVNNIRLATPKGAVVDTTLKAIVAGNESDTVKENEILRYAVIIENTGSEDVQNVKVTAKVPEGTVYINSDKLNSNVNDEEFINNKEYIDENKKEIELNVDNLAKGQTVKKYYEVKVNDGMAGKEIVNTVSTQYGEITKTSNEVKTQVKEADIELTLISIDAKDGIVNSGYAYRYVLLITNKNNKVAKNVKVLVDTNDTANVAEISYVGDDQKAVSVKNSNSITLDKLDAGETKKITFYAVIPVCSDGDAKPVSISARVDNDSVEYNSNEINNETESSVSLTMEETSENSGGYVKSGDTLKYNIKVKNNGSLAANTITLKDWIPNDVTLTKVFVNGEEISSENYTVSSDSKKNKKLLTISQKTLNSGDSIEYQIEVVVNLIYANTKAVELVNETSLNVGYSEVATARIQHILQPDSEYVNPDNNGDNNNNNNGDNGNNGNSGNNGNNGENGDNSNSGENLGNKIISGTAWVDSNENGQKESGEQALEGITVKLLDVTTNKFVKDSDGNDLSTKTSSTGFYSFEKVSKGQYLVIFEYDTTKYGLTTFEKQGVSKEVNSKVINKNIKIDGIEKKVAATEIINVDSENVANINIGLITAKTYDLQLDKYISKVTVQNNKTVTNNYTNQTLVKAEIDAKQVNSTTVVVEYTIKVTNKGDVTAYVKKIADYLSSDYKFSSELNKDWYQSGNDVYCTSLANEKLEPGESKEVTLTVIKQMKENNTGLVNNTAEIVESYNELGLTDVNSKEGNKVKGEDDMGSADLIISIRTGQVVMTVSLIISSIVILGVAIYFVRKLIINRNVI